MSARYKIEPSGVQAVVRDVATLAEHETLANAKSVQSAANAADSHLDPSSPVRGMMGPFALAAAGEIKSVYAQTADVLSATVSATNAYIEADLEMARKGEHGVTVTGSYVSGFDGDRAQRAAEQAAGGLRTQPKLEALDRREGISLPDWLAAVDRRRG